MATFPMLGTYIQEKISATQYRITYSIPDNCNENVVFSAGKYSIEIKLNPGQTSPSTTFIQKEAVLNLISNSLNYKFEQYEHSGAVLRKPSFQINE